MLRHTLIAGALALIVGGYAAVAAGQTPAAPAAKNDYSDGKNWLCLPGRKDSCAVDLTSTVVAGDGRLSKETWKANGAAAIDCFYVYPTVSLDTTANSDMNPGPEEHNVVLAQFARFGSQCRTFAPMYRQITLTALRANMSGNGMPGADRMLGYNDVVDAWNYYLQHDNKGRGVVLIGHSQGSGVLTQLIKNEIDGKPIQKQLISAILMGTSLQIPNGKDVGGAFKEIPLCHKNSQIGCAIAYASFRSTVPPPSNSLFGRAPEGLMAACSNPANLSGGSGQLHSYFSNRARAEGNAFEWTKGAKIDTPFVSTPGLVTSECVNNEHGSYLEITVHGNPSDPRADDITGDVITNGQVQANWGLHLIDANLAMGNLVDIVGQQSKTYLSQHKK